LGLAEAGYIPGGIYMLSTWYTRPELAKRVAIFFFGMFGGNAISPLLGAGILKLDGRSGLAGWKWIFLSMLHLAFSTKLYRGRRTMRTYAKSRQS
jgi:MFS family permease